MSSATRESSAESGPTRALPRWYLTLFSTDALERFGFFGMQAILVLYASAPRSEGGLGLPIGESAALFGAWIGLMFMLSHPGGWVGDRVLGQRPTLVLSSFLGMTAYLLLAVPAGWSTAVGLSILAISGGLFKPNHQGMINLMYPDARRRESGISLMYVGIQVSALLAPLVTGYLGERVNWGLGFSVAALSMFLCGLQIALSGRQFGGVGAGPSRPLDQQERTRALRIVLSLAGTITALLLGLWASGLLSLMVVIAIAGISAVIAPIFGYTLLYRNKELGGGDRRRLRAFLGVFLGATLFWMMNAHASSLLNLFARDHTDRVILGWEIPASWLQSATPMFILVLAPVIAMSMPRIGGKNNLAVKFSIGLVLMGGSFLLMSVATTLAADGTLVSPMWLLIVYLAHACGEVVVAAVTIAAAADVLPRQYTSRVLGLLWLFAGMGGGLGSGVVQLATVMPEPLYYLMLGSVATSVGLFFALRRRALTRALGPDGPDESGPGRVEEPPAPIASAP